MQLQPGRLNNALIYQTRMTALCIENTPSKTKVCYSFNHLDLRERTIRVEEELKHQRELMVEGFKQMDKRFEQMHLDMNKRFEQIDKRFEKMHLDMNKRFEQIDKRFEQMHLDMNKRFEQIDKRFEQVDKRFEQVDKRFEVLTSRIDHFMIWSFATTLTVGGLVIAAIKFLP